MRKVLLVGSVIVGALAASVLTASAGIACVGPVCWHTTERYEYPPEARVKVYEDTWKPDPGVSITWRERTGRGYWRDDKWVTW